MSMVILLSERLKELREQHHLTQAQLAKHMDVTRSSVNAWEMGITLPSIAKLVQLAELFHISTDYLLGMTENKSISIKQFSPQEQKLISDMIQYINSHHTD